MYEIINQILTVIFSSFTFIIVAVCIFILYFFFSLIINTFFPTRIILIGLKKEDRKEVIAAWKFMTKTYKVLPKMQSGIYTRLPNKKHESYYGTTKRAPTLRPIFRSNTFFYTNYNRDISPSYYGYTIHELTHTLARVLVPSFKEGRFRVTLNYDEDTYKASVENFIESTKRKYNISSDDIKIYVSSYACTGAGETLSECMRLCLRYEADKALMNEYPESYRIVKAFITEFDKIYKSKTS